MTTTPPNTQRGLLAANSGIRTGQCGNKLPSGVANPLADAPSGPSYAQGLIYNWRFNESGSDPAVDTVGGETLAHTNGFVGGSTGYLAPSYWAMITSSSNNATFTSQTLDLIPGGPSGEFSIMAWFQLQGGSTYSHIFRALRADGVHRFDLQYSPFAPGFSFRARCAHLNKEVQAQSTNTNGRWYFIQAEMIELSGFPYIRLRVRDPLVSHDTGWVQTYAQLWLNEDPSTATYKFVAGGADWNDVPQNVKTDQLSFWDRRLSDAEWDALYNGGAGVEL